MKLKDRVNAKAIELGKHILRMTTAAGSGHPSSGLSIIHIVTTLMEHVMRWDPADPWNLANDRLVLSEGHAVPAIYAVYADMGGVVGKDPRAAHKLTFDELATLRETTSVLDGHPNPAEGFPFFDAATGSLGQGLSVGAGLAIAARLAKLDKQIYVIIGDGESREGQIWEAMDFIADQGLFNVVPIFNCNGQGQADYVSHQQSAEMNLAKAESFGLTAIMIDGHDADAIASAIGDFSDRRAPLAIIARTHKGWGCASLKDVSNHGKPLSAQQLDKGIADLDSMYAELHLERRGQPANYPLKPTASLHAQKREVKVLPFAEGMAAAGLTAAVEKNSLATRRAYGAALLAVGAADDRIVALDGDVRNSTFADLFFKKFPQRFVECKIAEQNIISVAAGLSAGGLIPYASTFAKFFSRGYDQIEMAQISRANIKLVGSHAGVTLAADGPSQMSLHDVAYFRSASLADNGRGSPVCVSFHPADAVTAYYCTFLMANHDGMCYMRTHRPEVPLLYSQNAKFEIGGSNVLAEGDALTLVSAGYMVHECKKAMGLLAKDGIHCSLIDAYSFPLKTDSILAAATKTNGRILCVEDNYIGGLGSAIAEAAAEAGRIRVHSMTCRRLPKSAKTTDDILEYVGLSAQHISEQARGMLKD